MPALGFGFGHALDAVAAALELEMAEGPLAGDAERDFTEAAQLGGLQVEELELPAHPLGEPAVHLVEVAREQGRLVAAGPGSDLEDQGGVAGPGGAVVEHVAEDFAFLLVARTQRLELGLGVRRISASVSPAKSCSASSICRLRSR